MRSTLVVEICMRFTLLLGRSLELSEVDLGLGMLEVLLIECRFVRGWLEGT